jgi:hypothetical protein
MSDYLWDKTGEPDAEVERLEVLLGALGHAPRPLELPAEVVPSRRPSPRLFGLPGRLSASRLFAPAGLAAAAALLLASLLGAAALLRARVETEGKGAAASETRRGVRRETPPDTRLSDVGDGKAAAVVVDAARGSGGGVKDESAAVEDFRRGSRGGRAGAPATVAGRRRLTQSARVVPRLTRAAPAFESMSAGGGAASLFEGARLLTKEQLVYALRLTGAKLRDVRQKTRGRDGSETPVSLRAPAR